MTKFTNSEYPDFNPRTHLGFCTLKSVHYDHTGRKWKKWMDRKMETYMDERYIPGVRSVKGDLLFPPAAVLDFSALVSFDQ